MTASSEPCCLPILASVHPSPDSTTIIEFISNIFVKLGTCNTRSNTFPSWYFLTSFRHGRHAKLWGGNNINVVEEGLKFWKAWTFVRIREIVMQESLRLRRMYFIYSDAIRKYVSYWSILIEKQGDYWKK